MHAYWDEGPTNVSLNAICQRAGVSKPSVYREFGNDDGLTCAALENYAQCVLAQVLGIIGGAGSFTNKVTEIARLAAEDVAHERGCLFVKMRAVKPQLGDQTQALIAEMESMAINAYTDLLAQGHASGEWTGTTPIALGAQYLHAQIGLALDHRARGEDPKAVLALALSVLLDPKD